MKDALDVSLLESQAKIVKGLAKVAIFSSVTSVIVLVYGFIIPDPVIFLSIVLIPIAIVIADNTIILMFFQPISSPHCEQENWTFFGQNMDNLGTKIFTSTKFNKSSHIFILISSIQFSSLVKDHVSKVF